MTLEDFFTLSEMKDGLTSPSRVEELVTVMKKEKDSAIIIKNLNEATRQWTAVASTISATESKDCLDLFIQLDGFWFIDRWLTNVLQFGKYLSDSLVEESMTALLRALEKLQINKERSVSSGVMVTVKNLLRHNSSRVQDRARILLHSWNHEGVDAVNSGVENVGTLANNGTADNTACSGESSTVDASLSKGSSTEETDGVVAANTRNLPSEGLDDFQPERTTNVKSDTNNSELPPHISSDHTDMEDRSTTVPSSLMSKSVLENSSTKENVSTVAGEGTASIEACINAVSKQENEEVSGVQKLEESSNIENPKLDVPASTSSTVEHMVSSVAVLASAEDMVAEAKSEKSADANEKDGLEAAVLPDIKMPVSEEKSSVDEMVVDCSVSPFKTKGQDSESFPNGLQGSFVNNFLYGRSKDVETPFPKMEEIGSAIEGKEHCNDKDKIVRKKSKSSKRARVSRSLDVSNRKISDIGLEYGLVDALEVACKVAQEVEREVIGGEGPSCSSSEEISRDGNDEPSSPDSTNGNKEPASDLQRKAASSGSDHSAETDTEEEHSTNSDTPDTEVRKVESSKATLAQEPEPNSEKSFCDFDLNEGACSDETEHPMNSISTPVSVVSASKAAAVPGLPASPLQFEGTLGWKGSAATSAFRPASPRRNSDSEKMPFIGSTSSSPKQRLDFLAFDLNVTEGGEDKAADLRLGKQTIASYGLVSAESLQEANPRRSERFNLDLNSISEEGDAPSSDLIVEKQFFHHRNGHRSPSPAASSSMLLRNFDLNDRPVHQNDSLDQGASHARFTQNLAFGGCKPDDPVISLMGTRVEVNQRDLIAHSFLPNGKAREAAVDANVGRTGTSFGLGPTASYPHSSVFGYDGVTPQPTMSFSPAMYGPGTSIPYMVNSRGAPVMPPTMGSAIPYAQQQFIMSMNGAPLSLNGAMPPRSNFDLNSGFAMEGGSRDPMGLRQFMPSQSRSLEVHPISTRQPSSSGIGEKRKEPEGDWEHNPFNYKQQSPWK